MRTSTTRQQIITILSTINRPGMDNVIAYLTEGSDYFSAQCHHHHKYYGGLADHSLDVYKRMLAYGVKNSESAAVVGLLHDICTSRGDAALGLHGHGRRSVALLEKLGFQFVGGERDAILLHMHHHAERNRNNFIAHAVCSCDSASARAWHNCAA